MSTTDMAYDMTDSQTTQAHVRQIFALCHVLKSVSCQLEPFKTSRSKPKRRSSPAMPLLRRCVVFMALVVAMPPEGGPAAPPGGPSAPPGPSACPGSGGPAPPPGGGPGADPATLNALAGLWSVPGTATAAGIGHWRRGSDDCQSRSSKCPWHIDATSWHSACDWPRA